MKLDKNDNEKENGAKKPTKYFSHKMGFYVILFFCISIVAVSAMWGNQQDENHLNIEEIAEGPDEYQPEVRLVEDDITNEEKLNAEIAKIMIANSVVDESEALETSEKYAEDDSNTKTVVTEEKQNAQVNAKNESEQEAQCQEEVVSVMEEKYVQVMTMPVIGQIGLPFADDRLVFHKTLELWSTHKGIDIHAKEGVPVRAALEGEVVEIINDTIKGITITVAHSGNLKTQYSNLSTDEMVELGDIVTKGQIISGVGRSASNKLEEGPLLHFQVIRDGKMIDPQKFLVSNP